MQDRLVESILLALVAALGLFLLVAVVDWALPDASPLGDWAETVLALVTIFAILFGGLFAAAKFELFRDFEPHLTISHSINHRNIGNGYVHLDVTAVLENNSRVRVEIQEGVFVFFQIAPILDDLGFSRRVAPALPEDSGDSSETFVQWPTLGEIYCDDLSIEPGQTHKETVELVVPDNLLAMQVFSYFPSAGCRPAPSSGWGLTTMYDIVEMSSI